MLQPFSNDLRERVVSHVEAGHSCHEAAAHFDTSVSFAVNLMRRWRETGGVDPRPRGGLASRPIVCPTQQVVQEEQYHLGSASRRRQLRH